MKKNVLFVVDEKKMGGVSVLLQDLLNNFNYNLFNIDVLVLHNNGEMFSSLPKNINIIYGTPYFDTVDLPLKEIIKSKKIKLFFKKIRLIFDMKTGLIKNRIKKERKKILSKSYDTEVAFKDGFTALFTVFGSSKKKIHWLHYEYIKTNPNQNYDKLFKKVLPEFDQIVAVSKGVMDAFNKIYKLENKTIVIKNIVDSKKIIKKSEEKLDIKKSNKYEFISVGRLHYMKGYDNLLKAIKKLDEEKLLKEIDFKIYGDGPEKEKLLNLNKELNLDNKVNFMGQVMNPYPYMKNADLFILSSRYEPFGLVILEAMMLQTPVLACENAVTSEIIRNEKNGLIVKNEINGLYTGLKKIILNINLLSKFEKELNSFDYKMEDILRKIEELLTNE